VQQDKTKKMRSGYYLRYFKWLWSIFSPWHDACKIFRARVTKRKNSVQKEDLKMKRLALVFGIVMMVLALSYPVIARGPEKGRGYGRGAGPDTCWGQGGAYANLTEEQRTQLDKLHQKFRDETVDLRTKLWTKKGELRILLGTSDPDAAKAKALQKEISDLKAKMGEKRIDLLLEARKIAPEVPMGRGYGIGFGRHKGGYGHYWGGRGQGGYGHRWGGRGQGGCWN
jgi:zinc resistance-associated protein